ncbi:unc-50 related protein [Trypanosoma conorhini]|uniref:Unc-50 related protein n=1 Tax=Trypanosoma conorhini TaxID=83891 RepID=A0A3S5IT21_9TRYP|nr:unc-50 related protein [Trypanosoma conorhini]RNF16468.1 unc-50 related protein [Trypanosoma conorhini]
MIPRLGRSSRWVSHLPEFASRALQVDQMELDSALSQMYSLCLKPSLVSKMSKARKMTKNHYHRDDPAFIVLQVLALVITVVAYGLALKGGLLQILYNVLYEVGVTYLVVGVIMATITWVFANQFLLSTGGHLHEVSREVDWHYAFDIHCNGFFPYFVWTRVIQFMLLPLLLQPSFLACLVSNCLYMVGCVLYAYIVFLGYLELPMLTQQQKLVYPVPIIIVVTLFITLFARWNLSQWTLSQMWQS